jgi:hypothetical protein
LRVLACSTPDPWLLDGGGAADEGALDAATAVAPTRANVTAGATRRILSA